MGSPEISIKSKHWKKFERGNFFASLIGYLSHAKSFFTLLFVGVLADPDVDLATRVQNHDVVVD